MLPWRSTKVAWLTPTLPPRRATQVMRWGSKRKQQGKIPSRAPALALLLLGILAVVAACASETSAPTREGGEWGPLVVVESDLGGFSPKALRGGTLAVSDECAVLLGPDGEPIMTPVWGNARTQWDAEAQEIVFDDDRGQVRFRDGDEVRVGGGSVDGDSDLSWVAEPHSSCPEDLWAVHSIER